MANDHVLLRQAIACATEKSADGECGPFGAVVARNGDVLGEGWNQVVRSADPTAHAEIVAIRQACRSQGSHDLSGCTLYASCEPCPMCLAAIYWARIERVVYAADRDDAAAAGFDDEFFYRQVSLPPAQRAIPFSRALQDEGRIVLQQWTANPLRKEY